MGQKTNPVGFRLAVRRNWQSRWYAGKKDFSKLLVEDQLIRSKLMEKLKQASVPRIFIERASTRVRVKIYTARPGIVIGRKGQEIEKIKEELAKITGKEGARFRGPARVFDSEEAMLAALEQGAIRRGDGLDGAGTGPVRLDANDSAEPGLGTVSAVRRGPGGTVYVLQLDGELVRLSVARP